jgi:hypothetical protein
MGFEVGRWPPRRLDALWEEVERRKSTLERIDGTVYRCVHAVRMWVRQPAAGAAGGYLVRGGGGTGDSAGTANGHGTATSAAAGTTARAHGLTDHHQHHHHAARGAAGVPAAEASRPDGGDGDGDGVPWVWMHDGEPPTHAAIRWALDQFSTFTMEQGESAVHLELESLREGVATYPSSEYPKLMTRHRLCQISLTIDGLPSVPFSTVEGLLKSTQTRWSWRPKTIS